jgi:hypothetical protein
MSGYVPKFEGLAVTRKASADITGGQMVAVTGAGTVGPAGAAADNWVGVAAFDAKSGESVTVHSGGVQRPIASAAISAGDLVVTAASGKVATAGETPAAGTLVGVAATAATADGDAVEVHFNR